MAAAPAALPEVILVGRLQAGAILRSPLAGSRIRHVISIGDPPPWDKLPEGFDAHPARKLRLVFHDLERPDSGLGHTGCSREDVERLVEFCRGLAAGEAALVHCEAGICRSSAAALVALAVALGAGHEAAAVEALLVAERASAAAGHRFPYDRILPNRRVVGLADQLLGRAGRLLGVCQAAFSGRYGEPLDPAALA